MRPETRRALNILVAAALVGWIVAVVVTYQPVKPPPPPELKPRGGPVYFVPLGAPEPPFLDSVAASLEQRYPLRVVKLAGLPLDESVVDNRRRQLVAEALIALMRREYPREAEDGSAVLVGITAHDLYIASYTKWRFAFSYRMDERFAVVSTARMDDAAWGWSTRCAAPRGSTPQDGDEKPRDPLLRARPNLRPPERDVRADPGARRPRQHRRGLLTPARAPAREPS